jgi:SNF2 family DNA or RNA helicase
MFLNDESPLSDQLPPSIPISLKMHQRASVHACMRLEKEYICIQELFGTTESDFLFDGSSGRIRTRVGIIGDRVGSGKSYIILSIILFSKLNHARISGGGDNPLEHTTDVSDASSASTNQYDIRTFANDNMMIILDSRPITLNISLLVIPHNLTAQWASYVKEFTGAINYVIVSRQKHFKDLRDINMDSLDLIVVTNTFYNMVALHLEREKTKISRVIIDEADTIQIPGNNNVSAGFHWYVTASYKNLIGTYVNPRAMIVRSTFDPLASMIYRRVAVGVVVQNDEEFIIRSFEFPDVDTRNIVCTSPKSISVLNGMVDQNIIACLNAGDVPAAIQFINPTHKNTEDNIVTVLIDKHIRELKNTELRLALVPTLDYSSEVEKNTEMTRLTKKRDDIGFMIERIRERISRTETCCICYESITTKSVVPCCSNSYCFKCVCRWLADKSATCPLCKAEINTSDVYVVQHIPSTHDTTYPAPPNCMNKLDSIEKLLSEIVIDPGEDAKSKRLLIFSTHDYAFVGITERLRKLDIPHNFLRGNHNVINAIVKRYRCGEVRVLLVNPTHYGSGLNFEMTTDVIMYHQVRRTLGDQIIGRAMRMGRTCPLRVWNMCHENEISGNVLQD